jgi:hypothetical protein
MTWKPLIPPLQALEWVPKWGRLKGHIKRGAHNHTPQERSDMDDKMSPPHGPSKGMSKRGQLSQTRMFISSLVTHLVRARTWHALTTRAEVHTVLSFCILHLIPLCWWRKPTDFLPLLGYTWRSIFSTAWHYWTWNISISGDHCSNGHIMTAWCTGQQVNSSLHLYAA